MPTSVTNPVDDVTVLGERRECFAALVASGTSYREAAERSGFSKDYGWDLMQNPEVRQRVQGIIANQQCEDLAGIASRAWIETHFVSLVLRLESEKLTPPQLEQARVEITALMSLARLKGLVVEKRLSASVKATVPGDAEFEKVGAYLDELAPGERQAIQARVDALKPRQVRRKQLAQSVDVTADPSE
jgi:hypothetical protein